MPPKNPIQLFVGLGNPGESYDATRHNAGAWFVRRLAEHWILDWKTEKKLKGSVAVYQQNGVKTLLFRPADYMNVSGQAIRAICQFYKIPAESVLVAHDELDLPAGSIKLKFAGGHGGHNGLRDTIAHLKTNNFYRLRIGISHPGHRDLVHDYVLSKPSVADKKTIETAIEKSISIVDYLLQGDTDKATRELHQE